MLYGINTLSIGPVLSQITHVPAWVTVPLPWWFTLPVTGPETVSHTLAPIVPPRVLYVAVPPSIFHPLGVSPPSVEFLLPPVPPLPLPAIAAVAATADMVLPVVGGIGFVTVTHVNTTIQIYYLLLSWQLFCLVPSRMETNKKLLYCSALSPEYINPSICLSSRFSFPVVCLYFPALFLPPTIPVRIRLISCVHTYSATSIIKIFL